MLAVSETRSNSPTVVQPQAQSKDEQQLGSSMTGPGSAVSDAEVADRHGDKLEDSRDSDHEDKLPCGKLMSILRRMRDSRELQVQKIDVHCNALPAIESLYKNVKDIAEMAVELSQVPEEACQSAKIMRKCLQVATNQTMLSGRWSG
jgi:hypothetical protein